MTGMTEKPILNLTETAAYVGIPKRSFYRALQTGQFPVPPLPMMHPRKWAVSELDAWKADPVAYKPR